MKKDDYTFRKHGCVSIWIGTFSDEMDLSDYLDTDFKDDFLFDYDEADGPEVWVNEHSVPIREVVEGFSFSREFLQSALSAASEAGIQRASSCAVFYDRCYAPQVSSNQRDSRLIFLGSFQYSSVPAATFDQESEPEVEYDDASSGQGLFWSALERRDWQQMDELIDSDLSLDFIAVTGETPLLRAVKDQDLELVTYLLDNGADANFGNSVGYSPLMLSAAMCNPQLISLLLQHDALPNAKTTNLGMSPLHCAMTGPSSLYENRSAAVIKLLLSAGAEKDARDFEGKTPLMTAARYNCAVGVRVLLENNADPALVDNKGRTPLDLAHERKSEEVVKVFSAKPSWLKRWLPFLTE